VPAGREPVPEKQIARVPTVEVREQNPVAIAVVSAAVPDPNLRVGMISMRTVVLHVGQKLMMSLVHVAHARPLTDHVVMMPVHAVNDLLLIVLLEAAQEVVEAGMINPVAVAATVKSVLPVVPTATVMINPVAVVTVKKDSVEESAAAIVKSVRRVVPMATVMINPVAVVTVKKDFVEESAAAIVKSVRRVVHTATVDRKSVV
jgi:hypothetical protein